MFQDIYVNTRKENKMQKIKVTAEIEVEDGVIFDDCTYARQDIGLYMND